LLGNCLLPPLPLPSNEPATAPELLLRWNSNNMYTWLYSPSSNTASRLTSVSSKVTTPREEGASMPCRGVPTQSR